MKVFTKIALASTGMVEIKRNQAGFILYIQGRANPPKLERFVTFWSFPRWSNILHPLTGGRRNHLTICQIRYKETNSEMVTLSTLVLCLATSGLAHCCAIFLCYPGCCVGQQATSGQARWSNLTTSLICVCSPCFVQIFLTTYCLPRSMLSCGRPLQHLVGGAWTSRP